MIGCLRTRVRKNPIIALYFEFEPVIKFYNLRAQSEQYKLDYQSICESGPLLDHQWNAILNGVYLVVR